MKRLFIAMLISLTFALSSCGRTMPRGPWGTFFSDVAEDKGI